MLPHWNCTRRGALPGLPCPPPELPLGWSIAPSQDAIGPEGLGKVEGSQCSEVDAADKDQDRGGQRMRRLAGRDGLGFGHIPVVTLHPAEGEHQGKPRALIPGLNDDADEHLRPDRGIGSHLAP